MSRFTLRNLYLLPLLCCPSVVFAQFEQCSIEVPSAVHGSQIWLQLGHPLIMRNLNIAPTIEIRPGYRFNVMVSKDMVFTKPYQSFDY